MAAGHTNALSFGRNRLEQEMPCGKKETPGPGSGNSYEESSYEEKGKKMPGPAP